jgi:ribose 5-phosphate isomerase B
MSPETIVVAADHGGFELKRALVSLLAEKGYQVLDLGTDSADSVDYPDFAEKLTQAIGSGRAARGVLMCGSGIGMAIAANRHPGIRAALVHDVETARLAREHNDANVLVMGGRLIPGELAGRILETFLATPFEGGRHARRVNKLG